MMAASDPIVDDILEAITCRISRQKVSKILQSLARQRIYIGVSLEASKRVQAVVSMLDNGMSRAEISGAIQERWGLSRPTSYRLICQALEIRGRR